jgi:GNAT superfamily N-acetyltransferase
LKRLFELVDQIVEDMPRADPYTSISYEQWEKLNFTNPRLLPEGYIIAKHGSEYVGVSIVFKNDTEPQVLSQDDTGVRRDYRGKGIAVAMKIKVIEYAKKHNYKMIKTWNDSTNAAMLGINTKLGFKRQTGWVLMQKPLSY